MVSKAQAILVESKKKAVNAKTRVESVEWEAERQRMRHVLKEWVDRHGLRGKKIIMPSKKQRDAWAKEYFARTQVE